MVKSNNNASTKDEINALAYPYMVFIEATARVLPRELVWHDYEIMIRCECFTQHSFVQIFLFLLEGAGRGNEVNSALAV